MATQKDKSAQVVYHHNTARAPRPAATPSPYPRIDLLEALLVVDPEGVAVELPDAEGDDEVYVWFPPPAVILTGT